MNSQIESWRVQQYAANVYQVSQQKGSKLWPLVRKEQFLGKAEFFDRLGQATAADKVGRNTDSPNLDIDHTRRMVTTVTREWGTLVDRKDNLQNIHDPASEYAMAAGMALGRKRDNVIISAAFGYAASGEDGSSTTALGNGQKVAAVKSAALDYANVQQLRKAKKLMDLASVEGKRYIAYSADFLESLLSATEVSSSDFNTVKALVNGELNTFLGFEFIHCEELNSFTAISTVAGSSIDTGDFHFDTGTGLYNVSGIDLGTTERVAMAFAEGGLIGAETSGSFIARIEERADKGYSKQVYTAMDVGAVRMEEAKIVQLIYKA